MATFQFIQLNKTLFLIITSLVWAINFRTTFKNIHGHMDLGCYSTLKFDPVIILIKNVLCCIINFIIFWYSLKINSTKLKDKIIVENESGSIVSYGYEVSEERVSILDSVSQSHNLDTNKMKFFFWMKIFVIILIIYFTEEAYFMIANNHILDRLVVCMRNIGTLIPLFILSSLLIRKNWHIYKHRLYPSIIITLISLFMILFNAIKIPRFKKIFNINFLYYMIVYVLMAVESVLIKYLIDKEFINIFLILALKGLIGTIIFGIINILVSPIKFFDFFDKLMSFENEYMYEEFPIILKILYIISFVIFQYLKIEIISAFSESHFLSVAMITDVFCFPLYIIEKMPIEKFGISTSITFYLNTIFGIINTILLLIFNEIIQFKILDIDKNTNTNIDQRQEMEMELLNKDLTKLKDDNFYDEDNDDGDDNEDDCQDE